MNHRRQLVLGLAASAAVVLCGLLALRAGGGGGERAAEATTVAPTAGAVAPGPGERDGDGFSRSEEGARAAALAHAAASQSWLYLGDAEVDAAVRAVATPEAADRLAREAVGEVAVARESLAASPGRVWWLVRPLAWRVRTYSPERAEVAVWTVTVLSAADVAVPQADWLTVTVNLRWTGNGWRVDEVRDAPGPTPAAGPRDQPWPPEPFDEALDGFQRLGEAAGDEVPR